MAFQGFRALLVQHGLLPRSLNSVATLLLLHPPLPILPHSIPHLLSALLRLGKAGLRLFLI